MNASKNLTERMAERTWAFVQDDEIAWAARLVQGGMAVYGHSKRQVKFTDAGRKAYADLKEAEAQLAKQEPYAGMYGCVECGNPVHEDAMVCPHCGKQQPHEDIVASQPEAQASAIDPDTRMTKAIITVCELAIDEILENGEIRSGFWAESIHNTATDFKVDWEQLAFAAHIALRNAFQNCENAEASAMIDAFLEYEFLDADQYQEIIYGDKFDDEDIDTVVAIEEQAIAALETVKELLR